MTQRIRNAIKEQLGLRLAESRGGRVALHLACIVAGSLAAMHWQGVGRELRGQ